MSVVDLIARLRAAEKDERLSTGALYQEAADALEQLVRELDERPTKRLWDETSEALGTLRAKFAEQGAELARVKKDAERYRWAREHLQIGEMYYDSMAECCCEFEHKNDAAIDAAMGGK